MNAYSPASGRLRTSVSRSRSRKRRSGFSTVVGAAIMIAAVSMLGSVMMIWANSNFGAQQRQIGNYYEQTSNMLKETYVIEDVWLNKDVSNNANYVNITTRNIGSIAIQIKSIQISSGTNSFTWTLSPAVTVLSNQTYQANVPYNWSGKSTLDISVYTQRGSIERIVWKVS